MPTEGRTAGPVMREGRSVVTEMPRLDAFDEEFGREQVDRLVREVESLKREIADLTEARQQAADRIASLEAGEQESRDHLSSVYWYSDLAVLNYGLQPGPGIATPSRRSITARTEGRRREGSAPLSLEAPQ